MAKGEMLDDLDRARREGEMHDSIYTWIKREGLGERFLSGY